MGPTLAPPQARPGSVRAERVYAIQEVALAFARGQAVLVEAFDQMQVVVAVRVGDGPLVVEVQPLALVAAIRAVDTILLPAGHHLRAQPPTILPVRQG